MRPLPVVLEVVVGEASVWETRFPASS